ncbi:MAG: hypothetical protein ACR2NN_15880 [Bryobacteraceae bacterium]
MFVATGMEEYYWQNQLMFKDYQDRVKQVSEQLNEQSLKPFRDGKLPVIFLRDPKVDKEQLARETAKEQGIESVLVCAISALEPSPTFEHMGHNIIRRTRPSHVLYQYQIHPEVGCACARAVDARTNPDLVSVQHGTCASAFRSP